VVIFTRRDWVQLPDLDYEFLRHQWVEGSVEGHVYRSTPGSVSKEDGEDLPTWRRSICCRMSDYHQERFRWQRIVSSKDQGTFESV
jgi:hypothetical protein